MAEIIVSFLLGNALPLLLGGLLIAGQSWQAWIALDQWLHCRLYPDAMADETYSARCWREYTMADNAVAEKKWKRRVDLIDWLFQDDDHCRNAYFAEMDRKQLPKEYRSG